MRPKPLFYFLRYPGIKPRLYVFLRSLIQLFRQVERHVPKKGLIYDIGCGYGLLSLYLHQTSEYRRIIGLDKDKKRISLLRRISKGDPRLSFSVRDLTADRSLHKPDCIILYDILHHLSFQDQMILLKSCSTSLKEGGVLVVKEIDASKKIRLFYTWLLDKLMTRNDPLFYSSSKDHVLMLRRCGLSVRQEKLISLLPYPHILLIAKKGIDD